MSSETAASTMMNQEARTQLVPKLRFPEFRGTEGWEKVALNSIANPVKERAVQSENNEVLSLSAEYGLVLQGDFFGKKVAGDNIERYLKIVRNDFVYNDRTTKASAYGTIKRLSRYASGIVSPIYKCFRFGNQEDSAFWECYFESGVHDIALRGLVNEGARAGRFNISISQFLSTNAPRPEINEQQRISACLSSLDELIAAQAQKVEALKTHKKGLMQQLFPREGETQPRLRFPEFHNAPAWEEVALGDIAEIKLGKMLDKQKHTSGHFLPYLNNLAVRWNEVNTSDLPKMYFNDRELDRFGLRADDVVVCEGGEPGRSAVWDGRLPDLKFQKAIHRVRFNVPFEPKILVLHLENLAGTDQFEMLFTGGGIKHLTGETFAQLKIPLIPPAEQQRIADCLRSLDGLISAEMQKLEALNTHKKGLSQQLFPSPGEAKA
jgi:type I restriction enzyme S subunit